VSLIILRLSGLVFSNALLGSSIRFVMTRHEQGAAFMADVYGRLTGKAGVYLSTLGPGATNLTQRLGTLVMPTGVYPCIR